METPASGPEVQEGFVRVGNFGKSLVRKAPAEVQWQRAKRLKHGLPNIVYNKTRKEEDKRRFIGGMRGPARAVRLVPGLRLVGLGLRAAFRVFAANRPELAEVAADFGDKKFQGPSQEVGTAWRLKLREVLEASPPVPPEDYVEWPRPSEDGIWDAWLARVGPGEIQGGVGSQRSPLGV